MERKNISYFHFSKFFPKKGTSEFSTAIWQFYLPSNAPASNLLSFV
jgi:hypothetical protein